MRPQGEIRQAMRQAAERLAAQDRGAHWRAIAAEARVGWTAARRTVSNMVQAGDLTPVGTAHVAGSRRPVTLYAPASGQAQRHDPVQSLSSAVRGWSR